MNKPLTAPAALEAMTCLKDSTGQITIGRLTDELGHNFLLNIALTRSVEPLADIEGDSGGVSPQRTS